MSDSGKKVLTPEEAQDLVATTISDFWKILKERTKEVSHPQGTTIMNRVIAGIFTGYFWPMITFAAEQTRDELGEGEES